MNEDRFVADRRAFMAAAGEVQPTRPIFRPHKLAMWETMIAEETVELADALALYRAVDPADPQALAAAQAELCAEGCDLINVIVGLLLSQGLPVSAMADAIHQANLDKLAGGVLRREDGKVLKPEGWQPADKLAVIREACGQIPE